MDVVEKEQLVNQVIDDLKNSFENGDYTVLEELLWFVPNKNLLQALPEEEWDKYPEIKKTIKIY